VEYFRENNKDKYLDGFYLVIVDPNSDRPLNRFYGDHHRAIPVALDQDSLNAFEGSSPNPHALTNFEKWAERAQSVSRQNGSDALHLLFRDRHPLAPNSDEAEDAAYAQHFGPKFRHKGHMYEGVAGKQRQPHNLSPVAPAVYLCHKRKKSSDALVLEMGSYRPFVLGAGVDCVPLRLNAKSRGPLLYG
jgi:hypothetical protein